MEFLSSPFHYTISKESFCVCTVPPPQMQISMKREREREYCDNRRCGVSPTRERGREELKCSPLFWSGKEAEICTNAIFGGHISELCVLSVRVWMGVGGGVTQRMRRDERTSAKEAMRKSGPGKSRFMVGRSKSKEGGPKVVGMWRFLSAHPSKCQTQASGKKKATLRAWNLLSRKNAFQRGQIYDFWRSNSYKTLLVFLGFYF